MRTITYNFGWNTIRATYSATCLACGRSFERTVSAGYNDMADADYRRKRSEQLQEEARRLSAVPITCDGCNKSAIKTPTPVLVQELLGLDVAPAIAELLEQEKALKVRMDEVTTLFRPLRGRLFQFQGETYFMADASFGWCRDGFTINGYKINKRKPWTTTDDYVSADLSAVTFLDDTLDARKEAIKAAGKSKEAA
ncbi:MAG: hypothetical protein U0800_12640 [Isosphaeraceae bacterium]